MHVYPNIESLALENVNYISLMDCQHLFLAFANGLKRLQNSAVLYGWQRQFLSYPVPSYGPRLRTHLREIRLANCVMNPRQ
ncbi:hypothetical protein V1517DRAFT_326738 [Lipomyces orientalis]|uniref:Uncharacterized protein n=1 Tax=Lipomyces orientalis TaxID=1233043 RepID=A0ACC3TJI7_9ASCO